MVLLVLVMAASPAVARNDERTRETLKGLTGVAVLVEGMPEDAKRAGFDKAVFQTDVELKLRMAGIKIVTEQEEPDSPGHPYLYVNVDALHKGTGQIHAYRIDVGLRQLVRLDRNGSLAIAQTWSNGMVGFGDLQAARGKLSDHLDIFVNAWLSVNPKP